MKIKPIYIILILIGLLLFMSPGKKMAGTGGESDVRRSWDRAGQFVYTNKDIIMRYTSDVTTPSQKSLVITDQFPTGWTIVSVGDFGLSTDGKYLSVVDVKTGGVTDKIYTYTIRTPATAGTYTFAGYYKFEIPAQVTLTNDYTSMQVVACTPAIEVCDNNIDNDCDYSVNEGLGTTPCEKTSGVCSLSTKTCGITGWVGSISGQAICQASDYGANYVAIETSTTGQYCDNIDNDCDGTTDETITASCGNKGYLGVCATGTTTCSVGAFDLTAKCTGTIVNQKNEETVGSCDGLDNDCDGTSDESKSTKEDANCNACTSLIELQGGINGYISNPTTYGVPDLQSVIDDYIRNPVCP